MSVDDYKLKEEKTILIAVGNRTWKMQRTENLFCDGRCDNPNKHNRTIYINNQLEGERELEVIVHELLHAADWSKDENSVEKTARDIASVFWLIGYRKTEGGWSDNVRSKGRIGKGVE